MRYFCSLTLGFVHFTFSGRGGAAEAEERGRMTIVVGQHRERLWGVYELGFYSPLSVDGRVVGGGMYRVRRLC